jgi:hypothetical protein
VGLDQPRDLPSVAGHLKRNPILRIEASGEGLDPLRLGLDPPRRADLAALRDRHLAELEVNVESDCAHLLLLSSLNGENRWANDIDAFAL